MGEDDFDGLEDSCSELQDKLDIPREDKQALSIISGHRRRLEEKLEERRLEQQIADYEFE